MSEKPASIPVNQAFDPEERKAQQDLDAYLESRPYQDEQGNTHNPDTGDFINGDEYFDSQRESAEADSQTAYEDMSMTDLARKLGEAEYHGDKTMENDVHEVLMDKIAEQRKRTQSVRDVKHNAQRLDNLVDRVMTVKDRELERLRAEEGDDGTGTKPGEDKPSDDGGESGRQKAETDDKGDDKGSGTGKKQKPGDGPDKTGETDETGETGGSDVHVPDWVFGDDKARSDEARTDGGDDEPVTEVMDEISPERDQDEPGTEITEIMDEVDSGHADRPLLFEPGGIRKRVGLMMGSAARKLADLPLRGLTAAQAKMAGAQEYYKDEERGERRRKVTALVIGAVGLAGLSYLAHKGATVSGGGGAGGHAGETAQQAHQHAATGLEVAPVFPGVKAHQHAHEAMQAVNGHGADETLRHGHTIWGNEQHTIAKHHDGISQQELQTRTKHAVDETLQANGINYDDARHLPDDYRYHVPPQTQAEMLGTKS